MKKHTLFSTRVLMLGFFLLVCMVALTVPALAGDIAPAGELTVNGQLRVGRPVQAVFDMKGYAIATGAYPSVNVRFTRQPNGAKPQVNAGYPQTMLTFDTPGTYAVVFILNEVSKPSCGGVNAKPLLEETRELVIQP